MLRAEHLLLLYLLRQGFMGRVFISNILGVGEGKVRSILQTLRKLEYVESSRGGHHISQKGLFFLKNLEKNFLKVVGKVDFPEFGWPCSIAGIVRGSALIKKVSKNGMEERDIMVRNGALGAIVFRVEDKKPKLLGSDIPIENVVKDFHVPEDLYEGDLVFIIGGEDCYKAIYSFIKGAMELIGGLVI